MAYEQGLAGQRVAVLGGTSGIGRAVAEMAARAGAAVVVVGRSAEKVAEAAGALGERGEGRVADLGSEEGVRALCAGLGEMDHLVYTAGDELKLGLLAETDLTEARRAFELRYWSVLAAVKYGAGLVRPGGSVVLTTGIAGARPRKGWVVAASVCGTIEALTRALAVELAPVRVNAVSPGVVRSPLWRGMGESEREAMYAGIGARLPVGRVGEPEDAAAAYLFLMREGYATGQTVVVDGGTVLV